MASRGDLRTPLDDAPSLRAITFGTGGEGKPVPLLTSTQRQQLAAIATRLRLRRRTIVYREDTPASWIFIIASGITKSFRDFPSGKRRVAGFLFAEDLFGLAENGLYVNTVQAVTDLRLYRIPIDALQNLLQHDGQLQLRFLCKVTHVLRQTQRQKILVTRRDAVGRVAMFLSMLERRCAAPPPAIDMPMSRADVASYLGLSSEAVSRATAALTRDRTIAFVDRHTVRIVDRGRFDRLVADV
jgi:CRP/FNR family transcriptional regulator, anaerobic regulatory protein